MIPLVLYQYLYSFRLVLSPCKSHRVPVTFFPIQSIQIPPPLLSLFSRDLANDSRAGRRDPNINSSNSTLISFVFISIISCPCPSLPAPAFDLALPLGLRVSRSGEGLGGSFPNSGPNLILSSAMSSILLPVQITGLTAIHLH